MGVQLASGCAERLAQLFAMGEIIRIHEKTAVAILAPLNNMQEQIRKLNAGATGHENRQAKNSICLTLG
jgi:hypothetical protein